MMPGTAHSQMRAQAPQEGKSHSFFPLLGYASDFGFFGGVVYQRINYADQRRPFFSNTLVDVVGSTKSRWSVQVDYERIELFGLQVRNRSVVDFELNPIRSFFGIGNNTGFSEEQFENDDFFLEQRHGLLSFQARKPLVRLGERQSIDGVIRLKGSYTTVSDRGRDTIFFKRPPSNSDNGWVNGIGFGVIFDSRKSEFDPRSGRRFEAGVDVSTPILGSDYVFYELFSDVKAYISLTDRVVFAQRLEARHNSGDTPFWELPVLGSDEGLRGFALDRFMGDSSLLYMAELRSWLFSFFEGDIRVGAHTFYDTGRVYSENDSNLLFDDWKNTWGAGGAITLFNPDLIFRGEIGFSGEDYRIYAGLGYAF